MEPDRVGRPTTLPLEFSAVTGALSPKMIAVV